MRTVCRTQNLAKPIAWASIRLTALTVLVLCAAPWVASAEELRPARFRVTLESPEPIAWQGRLSLSEGRLEKLQPLNLDAVSAAGSSLVNGELRLHHGRPVTRDVFDVTVRSTREAELTLTLPELGVAPISIEAALTEPQTVRVGDSALVLSVARLPSDRLRIETDRRSLIFEPGEEFAFEVLAEPEGIQRGRPWEFVSSLGRGRGGEELWRDETVRVETPAVGASRLPVQVKLPTAEGVYTIRLKATRPAGFLSKFPTTRSAPTSLAERTFQVVVLDSTQRPTVPGAWQETYAFDPRNPSKWARRAPSWMRLGNLPWSTDRPLSSEDDRDAIGGQAVQIAPRGEAEASHWRAYPLPIDQRGEAYAVEVELLGEPGDSLTIAILEPDALGDLRAISGAVTHTVPRWNRSDETRTVRLVVRPRTDSPLLVLANPSKDRPASFGRFRVFRATPMEGRPVPNDRLVAIDWRGCDLPHAVGASHVLAPTGRYEQPDLQSFVETARTLAERVELAGANSAVIGVNEAGSAIYPSTLWKAPRYELGVWADGAADLPRKELLRLIALEFRRRGLRLIPAVRFDAPVVTLERNRDRSEYVAGSPVLAAIQRQALEEVINAIGGRETVAAVAVRATPDGWELLDPSDRPSAATSDRLVDSYRLLAQELQNLAGADARLFVLPEDILSSASLSPGFTPRLGSSDPQAAESIDSMGLFALLSSSGVPIASPFGGQIGLPTRPRLAGSAKLELIREQLSRSEPARVQSFRSDRHAVRLVRSAERLGGESGLDVLLPAIVAEPAAEAAQLAIAASESTELVVVDGAVAAGWTDKPATERRASFARLPISLPEPDASETASVESDVVATATGTRDGGTSIVVVNRSSWNRQASLTIETPHRVRGVVGEAAEWFNPGRHVIDLTFEPHQSLLWRFDKLGVRVLGIRIDPNTAAQRELAEAVADLQARDTTKRRSFTQLPNPSFEQLDETGRLQGWSSGPGVEKDSAGAFDGDTSVRLRSTSAEPAVLTSRGFRMPTTGQIALGMRLRPGVLEPSAELRIDVQQIDGDYRNSTRLTGEQLTASTKSGAASDWLPPVVFPIDDLPLLADGRLRLRFTLTGTGELNLDNLEAEDLVLPLDGFGSIELRREKFALVRLLSASQTLLDEGRLEACRELLDSYWARFLIENFPQHQVDEAIASGEEGTLDRSKPAPAETDESPSLSRRLRGYLPRWWR